MFKNNYQSIGFGEKGLRSRNKTTDDMFVYLTKPCERMPLTFQEEANIVANEILSRYNNIFIAMSGGLDSEFVATTFYNNGIPFKPVIFKWTDKHLNVDVDIWWAQKWCEDRNIYPLIISISWKDWLVKLHNRMLTMRTRSIPNIFLTYIADVIKNEHKGVLITGDGEPSFDFISQYIIDNEWCYILELWDPIHPSLFFRWSAEFLYSYINEYDINESLSNTNKLINFKSKLYNLPARPKLTGLENVLYKYTDIQAEADKLYGTGEDIIVGNISQVKQFLLSNVK